MGRGERGGHRFGSQAASEHDFIMEFACGYDAPCGEHGNNSTPGSPTIARSFLKDAPIILLDEATSALKSEQAIQTALPRGAAGSCQCWASVWRL